MSDAAGVPSVFTQPGTAIYAMVGPAALGPSTPEWRKIIKIEYTADGPQSSVVQDYTLVKDVTSAVQQAMIEQADSDDPPAQQQLLMTAWQALAVYLGSCDDEDKAGALQALKQVSNLMADGPDDGPSPTGTFGVTTQSAAAAAKQKDNAPAPKDKNGKPLPPWLAAKQKKMQAKSGDKSDQNSTTYECAIDNRSFSSQAGLLNHLQSVHNMSTPKAQAKAAAGKKD